MKKALAILLAALLVMSMLGGCTKKEEVTPENTETMTGGWKNATMDESLNTFDPLTKALEGLLGVNYEGLVLLGTQIVNGTNYAYLCKATVVSPDAAAHLAVIFVHESLEGAVELMKIQVIDVGAGAEEGEFKNMMSDIETTPMMGSWSVDPINMKADSSEEATKAGEVYGAAKELASATPVYLLATQLVAGTNYCFLAMDNGTFILAYVYADLEGNVTVSSTRLFDYPQLND